ncbi:MAG: rhomboid family intramembrane serine protease, partial [Chloroflexaceae bacterium]|nr:rhomboid family intramembrane serine protease [Chloroflexaceae bacterium]
MTQPPDNQDELDDAFKRMQAEFGPRRPPDEELIPLAPPGQSQFEPAVPPPAEPPPPPQRQQPRVWATWVLLGVNVLIYLLTGALSVLISGSILDLFTPLGGVLQLFGWKQNDLILQGEYWRLLTAMFLHGNLVHIFFNAYALFGFGPEMERLFGTWRFLALYFLAGLAGSVASYALSPAPSVGASGAIFGLIGGLATFYYLARQELGAYGQRQLQSMAFIIVINLMIGFSAPGIDNFAHLGGLLGGALLAWLL